jgi:hypothetical protein
MVLWDGNQFICLPVWNNGDLGLNLRHGPCTPQRCCAHIDVRVRWRGVEDSENTITLHCAGWKLSSVSAWPAYNIWATIFPNQTTQTDCFSSRPCVFRWFDSQPHTGASRYAFCKRKQWFQAVKIQLLFEKLHKNFQEKSYIYWNLVTATAYT